MKAYLIRNGEKGMTALKRASGGKSEITIHRYINGKTSPSDHDAYKLALAVGVSDSEAVALAGDGLDAARETG